MTLDDLIEELARLEKEATPGPWEWEGRTVSDGHVFIPECSSLGDTCIQLTHDYEGYAHDCDLLAFLRNHLPAILSALKENQRLREALTFVLPLAKGYAHEHPVGANQRHVDDAIAVLAALQPQKVK